MITSSVTWPGTLFRYCRGRTALLLRVLLSFSLLVGPLRIRSQDSPLTLAALLTQLQSSVDAIINNAQNAGNNIVQELAANISNEIAYARTQFHAELELQRKEWSAEAATLVDNISQTIQSVTQSAFAEAQDLMNQFQWAIASLPFTNKLPQVRAFSPIMAPMPPEGVDDLVFSVSGLFMDAATKGYEPSLVIETKPAYPITALSAFEAQFHVPKADLSFPGGGSVKLLHAKVIVPYKKRCFLFFQCRATEEFPEAINLLPASPGHLHISVSDSYTGISAKAKTSYMMRQDASHGDDLGHQETYLPDPGYGVIPESVHISIFGSGGDWFVDTLGGNCSTVAQACWKIDTRQHHCWGPFCPGGTDGVVIFKLSFMESTPVSETSTTDRDFPLTWGTTELQPIPLPATPGNQNPGAGAVTWVASYTDFDNVVHGFGSTNTTVDSPFLRVKVAADGTLAYSVYPFGVDAGSDLSSFSGNANSGSILSSFGNLGVADSTNLNPLTAPGFTNLKVLFSLAYGRIVTGQSGTVTHVGGFVRVGKFPLPTGSPGQPPPALTPAQRGLLAIEDAATKTTDKM